MKDKPVVGNDYEGTEVRLCEDGKYRWKYELNMITNPVIMITVFKIFFYIILALFVIFGTFLYAIHGDWEGLWGMAKALLIVLGIFAVLTFLGTALINLIYGGKYIVMFEMDDKSVTHTPIESQVKKSRKLGWLTFFVGLFAKRPTTAGAGMLSMAKTSSTSEFEHVRHVRSRRLLHTIKVNQLLDRNQVYVPKEDYDFVLDYIKSHCPNLKS